MGIQMTSPLCALCPPSQEILQEPSQLSRLRHAAGVREPGLVESHVGAQSLVPLSFLRQLEAIQGLLGLSTGAA